MKKIDPFFKPARILTIELPQDRRVLVVSDIHGNLPYLKGLLQQVGFSDRDLLIVDGDYLDKGPDSLGTLRFLMDLVRKGLALVLNGNCDDWERFLFEEPRIDRSILHYMQDRHSGIVYEMVRSVGAVPEDLDCLEPWRSRIREVFREEWEFIISRPHAIETSRYIFTHAGMYAGRPLQEHTAGELDKFDNFRNAGMTFDKWVIVGHWPVVLYHQDRVNAAPIFDHDRHIISIDGGCVLKDDGQLNCLILPSGGSDEIQWTFYDPFPERTVAQAQEESVSSYYIRWGDSTVRVLERGPEFSRCRHVRTGYVMDILTKYLFSDADVTDCNDCSDYVLPLQPGDRVRIIEETSRGWYVKHNGISGWYSGTFLEERTPIV